MSLLSEALARFAGHRRILVASDFDGTLADHATPTPLPGVEQVLNDLSRLSGVTVMLISGRRLDDLRSRFHSLEGGIVTVGEHGAEWPGSDPEVHPYVEILADGLSEITAEVQGAEVERKLFSLAIKYRAVASHRVGQLLEEAEIFLREAVIDLDPEPRVEFGKGVIDVSLLSTTKGDAVESVRAAVGAEAVAYFGDDVSDESVFEALGAFDVGVKVGASPSRARYRVGEPRSVVSALEELVSIRQ